MIYLTFEEYSNIGGVMDVTAFERNIDRASGIIDDATFNRVQPMRGVPRRVKALCRDLVEYLATNSNVNEKNVSSWSESQGMVSESVSYVAKSNDEMQTDIQNLIYDYLLGETDNNGTPLLYRGCRY